MISHLVFAVSFLLAISTHSFGHGDHDHAFDFHPEKVLAMMHFAMTNAPPPKEGEEVDLREPGSVPFGAPSMELSSSHMEALIAGMVARERTAVGLTPPVRDFEEAAKLARKRRIFAVLMWLPNIAFGILKLPFKAIDRMWNYRETTGHLWGWIAELKATYGKWFWIMAVTQTLWEIGESLVLGPYHTACVQFNILLQGAVLSAKEIQMVASACGTEISATRRLALSFSRFITSFRLKRAMKKMDVFEKDQHPLLEFHPGIIKRVDQVTVQTRKKGKDGKYKTVKKKRLNEPVFKEAPFYLKNGKIRIRKNFIQNGLIPKEERTGLESLAFEQGFWGGVLWGATRVEDIPKNPDIQKDLKRIFSSEPSPHRLILANGLYRGVELLTKLQEARVSELFTQARNQSVSIHQYVRLKKLIGLFRKSLFAYKLAIQTYASVPLTEKQQGHFEVYSGLLKELMEDLGYISDWIELSEEEIGTQGSAWKTRMMNFIRRKKNRVTPPAVNARRVINRKRALDFELLSQKMHRTMERIQHPFYVRTDDLPSEFPTHEIFTQFGCMESLEGDWLGRRGEQAEQKRQANGSF